MLRTICSILLLCVFVLNAEAKKKVEPELRKPFKELFNHKSHQKAFADTKLSCTDCHNFSVKSSSFDPLASNVPAGLLGISKKVCHECHMGKVELPKVNQCSVCHKDPEKLRPANHELAWKNRHGKMAQMDPDSCNSCHRENQNSCQNCHTQKNTLKPMVHRPNFRLTHSVEARANPAKCTTCHAKISTCIQCHKGGFK